MCAKVHIFSGPDGARYRHLDIPWFKLTLEETEHSIRRDKTADAVDGFEIANSAKELASQAPFARAKNLDYVAPQLQEVWEACAVPGNASAAEEDDVARVTGDEEVIWNRGTVSEKSHEQGA